MHFTQGHSIDKAMHYRQLAGENALQRSAHREAITQMQAGLALLAKLPDTRECVQHELSLQLALGQALSALHGAAAPEVEQTFMRAYALCGEIGDAPQLFSVLWGLWRFYFNQGQLPMAREMGEQLFALAERQGTTDLLLPACQALGGTLFMLGEFTQARMHLEQSFGLCSLGEQWLLAMCYGIVPEVQSLSFIALTLWCLGYPDLALRRSDEACELAQELDHPYTLAVALYLSARLYLFREEASLAYHRAERTIAVAREQGFALWLAQGSFLQGYALTAQGQEMEGLKQMRQGLTATRGTGQGGRAASFSTLASPRRQQGGPAQRRVATTCRGAGSDRGLRSTLP